MGEPQQEGSERYTAEQRSLQDHFDTRRLADRLEQVAMTDRVGPEAAALIGRLPFFFLATVDHSGQPSCSFKGGQPGFVRVVDDTTLAFPSYDGNGMFLSLGNLLATAKVGLLFVDFERPDRLRVEGTASLHLDDPLLAAYPEAQALVRVAVAKVFPNCPRYVPRMATVRPSPHVPVLDRPTPFAPWKRLEPFRDALPAADAEAAAGLPPLTIEEYLAVVEDA